MFTAMYDYAMNAPAGFSIRPESIEVDLFRDLSLINVCSVLNKLLCKGIDCGSLLYRDAYAEEFVFKLDIFFINNDSLKKNHMFSRTFENHIANLFKDNDIETTELKVVDFKLVSVDRAWKDHSDDSAKVDEYKKQMLYALITLNNNVNEVVGNYIRINRLISKIIIKGTNMYLPHTEASIHSFLY
jgi:hypothetical protein